MTLKVQFFKCVLLFVCVVTPRKVMKGYSA